jgi:hypothetical protein
LFIGYGIAGSHVTLRGYPMTQIKLAYLLVVTRAVSPPFVLAWNIPGHILFVAIAYQVFPQKRANAVPV